MARPANLLEFAKGVSGIILPELAEPVPEIDGVGRSYRKRDVLRRLLRLKTEGLKLFQPLPHLAAFHEANVRWRIVDGANRSSKTITGAYEFSGAFCGCDRFNKYPPRNGSALIVCLDLDHVGMIWRKLAEAGAFKIIRDEHTGLPRSVRPDPNNPLRLDPYDEAYREKWRDAPPLIPPRMLSEPAWEDRRKGIPRYVQSPKTGWRALFRSSDGKPPLGDHYNLGWFDEQIANEQFISELNRGIVALDEPPQWKPKAFWTATAQVTNADLLELREKADAGHPGVRAFRALIEHNPYIPDEEKQAFLDSLSDEEKQTRYYGQYALTGRRCYPTFDPQGPHGYEPKEIPPQWCRVISVDPGTQHCCTLLLAIDPEQRHVWVCDGFDIRAADAAHWAEEVRRRLGGHQLDSAVMDQRAGRQNQFSAGKNVSEQYWAALKAAGVLPRRPGPMGGFFPGSDDVQAREEALRSWMTLRGIGPFAGSPRLKVARGRLPQLEKQIRRAHIAVAKRNTKERRGTLEEGLLQCLEYAAAYDPQYYEPQPLKEGQDDAVYENFKVHQRRRAKRGQMQKQFGYALEVG